MVAEVMTHESVLLMYLSIVPSFMYIVFFQ